jgi:hypothetical protein
MERTILKRPTGFTLLALTLAWSTIGGLGLAYWAATTDVRAGVQVAFELVGLVYAGACIASAMGLWLAGKWTSRPLFVWALTSIVACWLPYLLLPNQAPGPPAVLGTAAVAGLAYLVLRYVRVTLGAPTAGDRSTEHHR